MFHTQSLLPRRDTVRRDPTAGIRTPGIRHQVPFIVAFVAVAAIMPAGAVGVDSFQARVFKDSQGSSLPYRLYMPKAYDAAKKIPLLLFLHDADQRGVENAKQATGALRWAAGEGQAKEPYIIVAPQCPPDHQWSQAVLGSRSPTLTPEPSQPMRQLMELLPALEKEFNVDTDRLYVTGASMGGYGTWDIMARRPDWFAAAVVCCGGADTATAPVLAPVPTWVFHGSDDHIVPVSCSRDMLCALWDAGGEALYTEYPGLGHTCWDKAYSDPALRDWMFSQKRDRTPPPAPTGFWATGVSFNRVDLTWARTPNSGSAIKEYRIYRDGALIGRTRGFRFTDTGVGEAADYTYTVSAFNEWGLESAKSEALPIKTVQDRARPFLVDAEAIGSPNRVDVRFSKTLETSSAVDPGNYVFTPSVNVKEAALEPDGQTVALTTDSLTRGIPYSLEVRNVKDRSGGRPVAAGSTISFRHVPSLVTRWKMDEGEGDTVFDSSGFKVNGKADHVSWGKGKFGIGLQFDGETGHIVTAAVPQDVRLSDALTVCAWLKKATGRYVHQTILARQQADPRRLQFMLDYDEQYRLRAAVTVRDHGKETRLSVSGTRLDAVGWHHVAMVFGSDGLELFIDGVSCGQAPGSGNLIDLREPFTIGGGSGGRDPFQGEIDDISIYSRALSSGDIMTLAKAL